MTSMMDAVQVALVTGASSGIGLTTALELARAGYRVIAAVRDPDTATALAAAIEGEQLQITIEQLDVTRDDSVARFAARIDRIDILVNNAGISTSAALEIAPLADAQRIFDVNYFGAVRMMRLVLPQMRRRRSGTVINVSSISGLINVPALAHYAASKAALEAATETLALEVARFGVRVALVEPGVTRTPMFTRRSNLRAIDPRSPYVEDLSALYGYFAHALRDPLEPADVARAILHAIQTDRPKLRYLLGDNAQALTAVRAQTTDEAWIAGGARRAMAGEPVVTPIAGRVATGTGALEVPSIEQQLKQMLAESCPLVADEIDHTVTLAETGMSSLQLQIFAARVEDAFEIRFGDTELGEIAGFADLVAAVTRLREQRAAS